MFKSERNGLAFFRAGVLLKLTVSPGITNKVAKNCLLIRNGPLAGIGLLLHPYGPRVLGGSIFVGVLAAVTGGGP